MPLTLKALPWKWIGLAVAALAAIATIIAGVNHALSQAKQAGRDEIKAQWQLERTARAQASAALTNALADQLSVLDSALQAALAQQAQQAQVITNRIEKETIREPRYTSPDCSVSGGMLEDINAARRLSHPAPAAASAGAGVPARPAGAGPDSGGAGTR